jgi:hypothetical protein
MACTPFAFSGVALDCGNVGGLKTLYIADVLDVTSVTVVDGAVTAIVMTASKKFKKFEFRRGNANFVSTSSRDDSAGTNFVSTVVTASFNHMETAKRKDMQGLATANVYVIAVDQNGKNWFIGYDSYGAGGVNGNSGAAMGDANNYEATVTAETRELPMEVAGTVLTSAI